MKHKGYAYRMNAPGLPLERVDFTVPPLVTGQALVQVAGCGLCHTDLSFWHGGVPTRKKPPLTLGHEISGTVLEGPPEWVGKPFVVPAVLPCGECDLCRRGRGNVCRQQQMPGNDFDGGFASHVVVPTRYLCAVPAPLLERHALEELAVVADAVSTSYQAVRKSGLHPGDLAVIVGVGGVGVYAAQLAGLEGGKVVALDVSEEQLSRLAQVGVTATINVSGLTVKEVRQRVKDWCRQLGAAPYGWSIFEMSGTRAGQELAYALLGPAATLSVVGFTLEKLELRLSNLMAYDACAVGTWGCRPELFGDVMQILVEGKLTIEPFIEILPLSQINDLLARFLEGKGARRAILRPDDQDNEARNPC